MSNTSFPDSAVVYILDDIPGVGEFQGSGVVIGPHTILTAAHVVYDADVGASADAISLYPGFAPGSTTYNPTGALGGVQSIHTIKVADNRESLSASATQSDFAVIDTSVDLTSYGRFALDPGFTSGDVVAKGYPASNGGNLTGTGGVVSQDGTLSDIRTRGLPLSPGYSGGPLYDAVERDGSVVDAVVGTVSTDQDAMKLTQAKVDLIRHWIASDQSLYAGGTDAPRGLVPQIGGTVSGGVNAAAGTAPSGTTMPAAPASARFTYSDLAAHDGTAGHERAAPAVPRQFADLVDALRAPSGGEAVAISAASSAADTTLAAPTLTHRISADG